MPGDCEEIAAHINCHEEGCEGCVKPIHSHEDFIKMLATNSEKLIVIDFYASWCKPCKMIAPKVEKWAKIYKDVLFFKINTNENCQTTDVCKVKSMPTFHLYRHGELKEEIYGNKAALIEEAIEKYRKVN